MPARHLALFAPCDRHNFGDLLFPHLVAALLPGESPRVVGLAKRNLLPWGGHRVTAVAGLEPPPSAVIHAGGEILDCGAWEAAVMLCEDAEAATAIRSYDAHPGAAAAWAAQRLGVVDQAPYVLGSGRWAADLPRLFNAVGGSDLALRPPAFIAEVVAKLRGAAHVSVRDQVTRDFLAGHDIPADLAPDPAVLLARLCGDRLDRHGNQGEVATLRRRFPAGYLALQFSADCGDDATLATVSGQLHRLPAGLGIVLFRAGAAPWHDDAAVYARLAARLGGRPWHLFASLDIWDIAALLANARTYAGTSLHGRIVAAACAVPAVSLLSPGGSGKVAAYLATWHAEMPLLVNPAELGASLGTALAVPVERRQAEAAALADRYRAYFERLRGALP